MKKKVSRRQQKHEKLPSMQSSLLQILWVINFEWFKWILVIIGALLSGGVLVLTFWPAVKDDTKRVAIAAIGIIFLCHLLLASGFVVSTV